MKFQHILVKFRPILHKIFRNPQKRQHFKKKAPSAKAKFLAPKALSKAPVWRKSAKYGDTAKNQSKVALNLGFVKITGILSLLDS